MITSKMKDVVLENEGILRLCKNAFEEECIVVEMLNALREVTFSQGISLVREGDTFYLTDGTNYAPISIYKDFMAEKAATLKFLKEGV